MRVAKAWTVAGLSGLLLTTSACDLLGSKKAAETKTADSGAAGTSEADRRLCASNATYARLKEAAFDEAKRVREQDTERLDALAEASVIRMERPLLESRDEALGLTVCSGRMILELPPGAEAALGRRRRLAADVTYSAQAAADGSSTVFKIDGGEPIIYRLASFDPARGSVRTAAVDADGLDEPVVIDEPMPLPEPAVVPIPRAAPSPPPPPPSPRRTETRVAEAETDAAEARIAAAERARRAAEQRAARAERIANEREQQLAAERRARAERVAEARRTRRGEAAEERPVRTAARAERPAAPDRPRVERPAPRPERTARPSFNCRYARSRVEKLICGSDDLAARDREMAAVFYRASDRSGPEARRRLSASRLRFLAYRDRCGSEACVANAYSDRIDEINDLAGE